MQTACGTKMKTSNWPQCCLSGCACVGLRIPSDHGCITHPQSGSAAPQQTRSQNRAAPLGLSGYTLKCNQPDICTWTTPTFVSSVSCFPGSSGSNCSKNEGLKSGGSSSEPEVRSLRAPSERSVAPPSERSMRSSVSHRSAHSHSIGYGPGLVYGPPGLPPQPQHMSTAAPGAPPGRELAAVPPELTASRQSLRLAVGNAGEFFVDVM